MANCPFVWTPPYGDARQCELDPDHGGTYHLSGRCVTPRVEAYAEDYAALPG